MSCERNKDTVHLVYEQRRSVCLPRHRYSPECFCQLCRIAKLRDLQRQLSLQPNFSSVWSRRHSAECHEVSACYGQAVLHKTDRKHCSAPARLYGVFEVYGDKWLWKRNIVLFLQLSIDRCSWYGEHVLRNIPVEERISVKCSCEGSPSLLDIISWRWTAALMDIPFDGVHWCLM